MLLEFVQVRLDQVGLLGNHFGELGAVEIGHHPGALSRGLVNERGVKAGLDAGRGGAGYHRESSRGQAQEEVGDVIEMRRADHGSVSGDLELGPWLLLQDGRVDARLAGHLHPVGVAQLLPEQVLQEQPYSPAYQAAAMRVHP
ncbi:MAG: hypothetical protein M0Z88_08295 [Actinomycetota bacterium]|nr:hypothetical protein [Actinomycetota bacterium]